MRTNSIRGLARTTFALKRPGESEFWFAHLLSLGATTAWDWQAEGARLSNSGKYIAAGQSYEKAASLGDDWKNWCTAAMWLSIAREVPDSVLSDARKCIEKDSGKKDFRKNLGRSSRRDCIGAK